jgi:surface protein
MFYDFGGCFHFEFLDLSSFDTSNVIDMSYMFYNLLPGEFASLDLSGFDTSKVTNMKGIFEKTPSLYLLNLSNFDISKVDNISKMLYDMEDITFLDLTGFNFENIEDDQINEFFNPKLDLEFLISKILKVKMLS